MNAWGPCRQASREPCEPNVRECNHVDGVAQTRLTAAANRTLASTDERTGSSKAEIPATPRRIPLPNPRNIALSRQKNRFLTGSWLARRLPHRGLPVRLL